MGIYFLLKDFLFLKCPVDSDPHLKVRDCIGNSLIRHSFSILLIITLFCLWTDGIVFGKVTPHKGYLVIPL